MKNKLVDLNNHLFAQLERLGDEEISEEDLAKEIQRTDAIAKVAVQIINTANVAIAAAKIVAAQGGNYEGILPLVEGKGEINSDLPALADHTKARKV